MRYQLVNGEQVTLQQRIEGDAAIKEIEFPGRRYREYVKLYNTKKMRELLHQAGFEILARWGNYKGEPWTETAPRQIYHCRVR